MATKLGDAIATALRRAYAWADRDGDPHNKSSYKFIHHEVDANKDVGAANMRACISGIGDLARHLRDGGKDVTELK